MKGNLATNVKIRNAQMLSPSSSNSRNLQMSKDGFNYLNIYTTEKIGGNTK